MTNADAYTIYQDALEEIKDQIEVFSDLIAQEALESRINDDPYYLAKFALRNPYKRSKDD